MSTRSSYRTLQAILDHATIAMCSQICSLLSSLNNSLIRTNSSWLTLLIQVINTQYLLTRGPTYSFRRMLILITIWRNQESGLNMLYGILKGRFASLHEMRSQIRNRHEMKAAIKWIISCVVLHNLLADLKDRWNKLYKEEEPELAPPVGQDYDDTSNDGLRGVLRPITLSHFA